MWAGVREYAWAQLNPGIVVEAVAKNSEAEKAGLQEGDTLLTWSRGDAKGEIESPFHLEDIEVEQAPQGNVTLEGLRGAQSRAWTVGPDDWGIKARPNLSENLLAIYRDGRQLAKAGKLEEAAARWQAAAIQSQGGSPPWLASWFLFQTGNIFAGAGQFKESVDFYEQALQNAKGLAPEIAIEILHNVAWQVHNLGDWDKTEIYSQQALKMSREANKSFGVINRLWDLGVYAYEHGNLDKAEAYGKEALSIAQKLSPEGRPTGNMLLFMGGVAESRGDLAASEHYHLQALAVLEKASPNGLRVVIELYNVGSTVLQRGDLARAEEYFRRGLAIAETYPPESGASGTNLKGLGYVAQMRGDLAKAEEYFRRGLAIREMFYPGGIGVARTLNDLAGVADMQGDLEQADKYASRALAIINKGFSDSVYAAEILTNSGLVAVDRGDLVAAENSFGKALAIYEKISPDTIFVANLLNNLGRVTWQQKDYPKAEEYLRRGLALAEKGAPGGLLAAESLNDLGDVYRSRGDAVEAGKYYSQALAIREKLAPESPEHIESLMALASVLRDQQPDRAAQLFDQAVNGVESEMARLGGTDDSRSNFRAQRAGYYKDYVDLLVQQRQPEHAFNILERSRARTLLEILAQAHVNVHAGVDAKLLEQESSLQADIRAKSERRLQLLSDKQKRPYIASVDQEIKQLLGAYQEVERQIRLSSPGYAALTQPQPLTAKEVQQQLLDDDTILLEYSLGEDRSYVFAVTANSLTAHELPKRAEIEGLARKIYDLLTARSQVREGETTLQRKARLAKADAEYVSAMAKLSQLVLGPVASQVAGKRLLIVSDGALQYIPFSILPEPVSGSRLPLVAGHEIVNLPSASALAVLRQTQTGRKEPLKAVAVLADPVFSTRDARVQKDVKAEQTITRSVPENQDVASSNLSERRLTRSARDVGFLSLPRLPFTRQEADAIMSVAPSGEGMEALDFKASRELGTSPELANYRIVHLATHGLVDSEHPEFSGLVLSLVDKQGKQQNGFLGLEDIYNLNLPVDMVVLSACETGLGKEIRGEGLIGLTRGFMYAGASRVVASLWSVDDVATAELMSRFYKGILREGLSPAAALRQAQLEMQRQKRWRNPYYWGGFVLHGEWKSGNGQGANGRLSNR
jgi:CHAT domain-containing protein/tetratricopeptide (TPR) repeat protein